MTVILNGKADIERMQWNAEAPQVCAQPYLQAVSEGDVEGHTPWFNIGYTPTMTTTESEVWSKAGKYVFPTAAAGMEIVSSDNTQDIGTSIFSGTSTGGSTTTLIDTGKDFTAGTPVAVGDCVILDKSGTTPEFGYVTAVATTTLTVAGGFSRGGTGASRDYYVIDKSAYSGAQAIGINYLDGNYATKGEIVILNGTTVVPTVNTNLFRIQGMSVIAAGSGEQSVGNISLRNLADTPTYGYISAGYTVSRASIYTVPANKTIYIVEATMGYGYSTNQTHYGRIYIRANENTSLGFNMGQLFRPLAESIEANSCNLLKFDVPIKLMEKTDIKTSCISTFSGIGSVVMRGWIE